MTVAVTVDLGGPTPVYEQIRAQIAGAISTGELGPGDRLPTVRGLAADLGIAVNTVVRAYAELESSGLVRSGRRVGTVVLETTQPLMSAEVLQAADVLAEAIVASGLADQVAHDVFRSAVRRARNRAVMHTASPAHCLADRVAPLGNPMAGQLGRANSRP